MISFRKYTLFWTDDDDEADVRLVGSGGGQISGPIAGGMGSADKDIPAVPICATAVSATKKIVFSFS